MITPIATTAPAPNNVEKKEVNVEKPEDLKTLTIGVQQGTTGDILSSEQVEKDSQMKRYPKGSTAIQALKKRRIFYQKDITVFMWETVLKQRNAADSTKKKQE